jgi:hypothetical protein
LEIITESCISVKVSLWLISTSCLFYGPRDLETSNYAQVPTSKKNQFFYFFSTCGMVNERFYHLRGTIKVAETTHTQTHTHTAGNDENA